MERETVGLIRGWTFGAAAALVATWIDPVEGRTAISTLLVFGGAFVFGEWRDRRRRDRD
jgi:hypothetical protein